MLIFLLFFKLPILNIILSTFYYQQITIEIKITNQVQSLYT